jgi:gamma-glutamyl:cysteine ligase YbdK (ATP-grasp superfamily)
MLGSLIDPPRRVPVRDRLAELVEQCEPVSRALGCADELARTATLAAWPGAARQRAFAARGGLESVVEALSDEFVPASSPSGKEPRHTRV